jgi:hypothetical protein
MEDIVKGIAGEYVGNYTGPYWSNGKVQESVEWGDSAPQSELDRLSRQHDSAYAKFKDDAHREAADMIYNREAQKLKQRFPSLAGNLVLHGNRAARSVGVGTFMNPIGALGGLIYTAGGVIAKSMAGENYLKKELTDVSKYYENEPGKPKPLTISEKTKAPLIRQPREVSIDLNGNIVRTKLASSNKVVPDPEKSTRAAELVAKQAKKFENYVQLEKEALKSTNNKNQNIPIPLLGYRPMHLQKAYRKRKKNKIHLAPRR